jgi:hypothetical protein
MLNRNKKGRQPLPVHANIQHVDCFGQHESEDELLLTVGFHEEPATKSFLNYPVEWNPTT